VKANRGAPGVDGVTFKALEAKGEAKFIKAIREELVEKSYRPSPVLRVMIPKPIGKMRSLGIPTIKDRVVQMACNLINQMKSIPEDIRIVRCADDFVLMSRRIIDRVIKKLHEVLERMELTVNSEKTSIVNAAEESFDFLGFTFHKRWSRTHRGVKYYHVQASMKTMKAADMLKGYLKESLYRYYRRKSQRYNTRKIQNAFYVWRKYGLIDPMQYCKSATPKA